MSVLQLSDAVLLKKYIQGDENSLAVLIERHQTKIYGFIYSKLGDRDLSDDIFQDTFVKVVKSLKINGYQEEGKFVSWVTRIAHNLIIDHYRRSKKNTMINSSNNLYEKDYFIDNGANAEEQIIDLQISNDLTKMIDQLPDDQKEVVKMRMYDDLSFKEIAEMTNVSINTALGRMRYAIINLRKMMEKNQIVLTN
ncbi:MAG: RNA polymerase sigma factor [Flavobacterium sp.]|jgi:RNA polymerase sigma-70 factor, ECF subfamily